MDLLRYPEPRQYRLLDPLRPIRLNGLDMEMLRYPRKELYYSMDWYRDDDPDPGLLWTSVDTLVRLVIPPEWEVIMSWGLHMSWPLYPPARILWRLPRSTCGDTTPPPT